MKFLARRIRRQLEAQVDAGTALLRQRIATLWPLSEQNRKAKIAAFAREYGFCSSLYKPGLCAIFERTLSEQASAGAKIQLKIPRQVIKSFDIWESSAFAAIKH
jgi:hypothetical protein